MNQDPTSGPTGKPAEPQQPDFTKPVAYDTEGRPLYLHPPAASAAGHPPVGQAPAATPATNDNDNVQHQYVHITRAIDPEAIEISPEILQRHEESKRRYPRLNLSRGEYIISAIRRHPIGLFQIWFIALLVIAVFGGLLFTFLLDGNASQDFAILAAAGLGLVAVLVSMGALVATLVYNGNRFFLTNESVIQEIQTSLFSRHEQTVSLANIEDASYRQDGLLPQLLNFGLIRLSTEGDETTYRFNYVSSPKQQIATLNNAVEAFKNGRPVEPPN